MWKPRPGRLRGFSYIGIYRYFLTLCTETRRPAFGDASVVAMVRSQFLRSAMVTGFQITAYCYMPDHLHLLAEGRTKSADLRRFVRDAKQRSGYAYAKRVGVRLWQDGYYDQVLRGDDAWLSIVRYILENPVRAGLAAQVRDYPFSGSEVYSVGDLVAAWESQG